MAEISLRRARTIIRAALAKGRAENMQPLAVVVLDAGGWVKAFEREDGASNYRFQIAHGVDVRVDRGNFANAGAALMTFLATRDVWVQADFTENNLGNIKPGDRVGIVFDALPGKVIRGTVRTTGFGVQVDSAPLGSLPTIENNREWLRDAQRFSVVIDFELPSEADRMGIRVGAQASVIVYTGGGFLFNTLGRIKMRLESLFTYAY